MASWKTRGLIRWGIIGCGDVTEVKSGPAFNQATGSALPAVMRRNGELAADNPCQEFWQGFASFPPPTSEKLAERVGFEPRPARQPI